MVTNAEGCEHKRQLLQDLLQAFSRLSHITGTRSETSCDGHEHAELNDTLRAAVNEREQALRALENHQEEHGC